MNTLKHLVNKNMNTIKHLVLEHYLFSIQKYTNVFSIRIFCKYLMPNMRAGDKKVPPKNFE